MTKFEMKEFINYDETWINCEWTMYIQSFKNSKANKYIEIGSTVEGDGWQGFPVESSKLTLSDVGR